MDCDAAHVGAAHVGTLASWPHCDADPHLNHARPKFEQTAEHTGAGFSHDRQANSAPPGAGQLHPQRGNAPFAPARVSHADRTYFRDRAPTLVDGVYPRLRAQYVGERIYGVRRLCRDGELATVTEALAQWEADKARIAGARTAVIELRDSDTYYEAPAFNLEPGEHLRLRAVGIERPVLRILDGGDGERACLVVRGGAGSRFMLDGVALRGGAIDIASTHAAQDDGPAPPAFTVRLRHCTLVPGWDPASVERSAWRGKPSIDARPAHLALRIEHSILGPIRVASVAERSPMLDLHVGNSIIDGGHEAALAISDDGYGAAMAQAQFSRVTVIGAVQVQQLGLAANSLFLGALLVAQRSTGCVSFSYLAPGSKTPHRIDCQPELAQQSAGVNAPVQDLRVQPRFATLQYGAPGYGRLVPGCAEEITCGADDHTQMGATDDQRPTGTLVAVVAHPPLAHTR